MKIRQSNIELLRLVCMFMIVFGHYIFHGIIIRSELYPSQSGLNSMLPILLHSMCLCAVNTFVLISGYFSIRPKAKSFFNLYFIVAIYACLLYSIHLCVIDSHINRWSLYNTIIPFSLAESSNGWWFMPQYLILFILSPIINKASDVMSKKEIQLSLLLLSVVIIYFGWYRGASWAQGGFNFIQFVFMYFIGRYLALYTEIPKRRYIWAMGWFVISITTACLRMLKPYNSPFVMTADYYNNPLCIMAAVCLFNVFRSISIESNCVINWCAASTLSIYLLQDCSYFREFSYGSIARFYDTHPMTVTYTMILAISIGIMIGAICFDKVRMMITNPLVQYCVKYYDKLKEIVLCRL